MMRTLILMLAAVNLSSAAAAAPLTVRVTDAAGHPVRDAVVTLRTPGAMPRPSSAGRTFQVAQKNLQFQPFVIVVPVGAEVSFPNFDPTKHHVYSFSPAKQFELKLFARDQSRKVRFDKPGVVALGCNIHDAMSAFIVVADSPWTAVTDARGVARFDNAPGVQGNLSVWHPYLRAPGNLVARTLGSAERTAEFAVRLRPPPMHSMGAY
jgi:plastocyanin